MRNGVVGVVVGLIETWGLVFEGADGDYQDAVFPAVGIISCCSIPYHIHNKCFLWWKDNKKFWQFRELAFFYAEDWRNFMPRVGGYFNA